MRLATECELRTEFPTFRLAPEQIVNKYLRFSNCIVTTEAHAAFVTLIVLN